ncbi:beta strand repeat-containing protein [Paraburkholderia sp. A3RO-2L]|uniref:beta strand repeat-containing protein n=1 Tax=unclassified Paraburkholderia TaxID=2615204 RepID=UPI003DA8B6CD
MHFPTFFKKSLLAAALTASLPALASQYFVVVPSPKHTAGLGNISVTMSGYALPGAIQGQAYAGFDFNSVLQVRGDPNYNGTGVHFSVAGGALPAGLTLSSSGQLSGTPTQAGTATFQVMAAYKTKAGQQSYQLVTMAITVALATATPPQAIVGQAYSYNLNPLLTVNGDMNFSGSAVTWNVVSSSLPAGLYLTSAGYIAGTPAAAGTGSVTARASYRGVGGQQSYQVVTLNIGVSLAAATLPEAQQGVAYAYNLNSLLSITGEPSYNGSNLSWTLVSGSLPPGLSLTPSGYISGTPTGPGSGSVTVQATYRGVNGQQTYQVVTLNISVALAAATPPQAIVGAAYSYNLAALLAVSGDPAYSLSNVTWNVVSSSLPQGLYLTSDGRIAGTPTVSGTGSITARATYKGVNGQQTYQVVTLAISVGLAAGAPPQAIVGQPYGFDLKQLLTVTGDSAYAGNGAGVTWNVVSSSLPAGLYLTSDGWIGGKPTAGGTGSITAQASYKGVNGQQTYQLVTLSIGVSLAQGTPPLAMVGQNYSYDLNALLAVSGDASYSNSGVTWSLVSSTLPAGLVLDSTGHISGTPTAAGSGQVTAQATYRGVNGQQTYQVTAQVESVSLASATLPAAKAGVAYTAYDFKPLVSGNDPSFSAGAATWSVVDSLPAGMSLSTSGVLSGTPSAVGSTTFHLKATYKGASGQQAYMFASADNSNVSASTLAAFSGVKDYTTSTQSLTLTNSGTSTANLTYSSSSQNFSVSGCASIPANSSCTATVSFYPTGVASYTGQLSILGAANGTVNVPLSGSSVINVQTFTTSTTWVVPARLTSVKVLVVGGGGGPEAAGGVTPNGGGGVGGGGGQVIYNSTYAVTPNASVGVTVGVGGDAGQDSTEDGTASAFGSLTAAGGLSGYEGGTSGNGYASGGPESTTRQGGGGGGAGGPGGAATATVGGAGGPGLCYSITGTMACYGGGGGGATNYTGIAASAGGSGVGGVGGTPTTPGGAGAPNTGSGGGGGGGGGRYNGANGVVIVAY